MELSIINCNIVGMKVDTNNLITVGSYAKSTDQTTANVYRLIKAKEIDFVVIDGVKFILKSN